MSVNCFLRLLPLLALAITAVPAGAQSYVCLETNQGDICMDLLPEAAPNTVSNFLNYVTDGDYDETVVHRSVRDFVIQGGGFSFGADTFLAFVPQDPPILNEFARSNVRGTVAMAKGSDPNSATSQWFINVGDNTFLDTPEYGSFTVFAEVVQGMEVVDAINALRIGNFTQALGSTVFSEMPVDMAVDEVEADLEDFVVVTRAYATDVLPGTVTPPPLLPWQCSVTSPGDTLTEFCGSTLSLPVLVNGVLYEATLRLLTDRPGPNLVFAVERNSLRPLNDNGSARAVFSNNELVIPSVRIGAGVVENVRLQLTNLAALEFTVQTFTRR